MRPTLGVSPRYRTKGWIVVQRSKGLHGVVLVLLVGSLHCGTLLGLGEFEDQAATEAAGTGGGGQGGQGATSTSATSTGVGGGGGAGGQTVCSAGDSQPCYSGPAGTEDVGLCKGGTSTCLEDGSGYGDCEGETVPVAENCATPEDDDCNGTANDGCPCRPGTTQSCYSGPAGTEGVGLCAAGTQTCDPDGLGYGACSGEALPAATDDCYAKGDEDCDGVACSETIWAQSFAGTAQEVHVAADGAGNIYLYGRFSGSLQLGANALISAGGYDLFLAKLDHDGNVVWAKRFGDAQSQLAGPLAVDPNGVITIGTQLSFSVDFGGGTLTASGYDLAIARLDTNGTHLWSKKFGDVSDQHLGGLAVDPAGDVVVVGDFAGTINFGNGNLTSQGGDDMFLAKLKGSDGSALWSKRFGDTSGHSFLSAAVDGAGSIWVAGSFTGTVTFGMANIAATGTDVFLARFDGAGANSCSKAFDASANASVSTLTTDFLGNAWMGGGFSGVLTIGASTLTDAGLGDLYLTKASVGCLPQLTVQVGGSDGDINAKVATDSVGNAVLGFQTKSAVDLGTGPIVNAGLYDVLVAKLDTQGALLWYRRAATPGLESSPYAYVLPTTNEIAIALDTTNQLDLGTGVLPSGLPVALFAP